MSKPSSNLRLFVAIHPPAEIARELTERVTAIGLPAHAKIVAPDQIHLTIQFIGDTPAAAVPAVRESVERSAAGLESFWLTATMLISLPERGSARLVAAETDAPPALLELHARLARRLARNVRTRPGEGYRPHLTLCRFAAPVAGLNIALPVERVRFVVDRIALMRSTLWHGGATHHELMCVALT